jgi:electron transfer flavoprotein alpha subunit
VQPPAYIIVPAHRYEKVGRLSLLAQLTNKLALLRETRNGIPSPNYFQPLEETTSTMVTANSSSKIVISGRTNKSRPSANAKHQEQETKRKELQQVRAQAIRTKAMKHRPDLVATMSLDELEHVIQEEQQTADRHQQAKALQKARAIVLQSRT